MATRHSTDTRARRFERVILRTLDTRNRATLRAVAILAHDRGLGAVEIRAQAALRFVTGGRAHG